jgi:hypothetical protein
MAVDELCHRQFHPVLGDQTGDEVATGVKQSIPGSRKD